MRLSAAKLNAIINKTSGRCAYCGRTIEHKNDMTIDHIKPRALGGSNDLSNLLFSCKSCNSAKASSTIEFYRLRKQFQSKYGKKISKETIDFLSDNNLISILNLPDHKFFFEVSE